MFPSLFPDSLALFGWNIVAENHINSMEDEVVRLGNILKFFNKSGRISSIGSQSLFYWGESA